MAGTNEIASRVLYFKRIDSCTGTHTHKHFLHKINYADNVRTDTITRLYVH